MRGKPFEPGNQHGRGRPPGSRNKAKLLLESLEEHAEAIVKKCVVMAMQGNTTALRLCMERVVPQGKQRPVRFKLGASQTAPEVSAGMEAILDGVARGRLTTSEGLDYMELFEYRRRAIHTEGFDARLSVVEQRKESQ